MTSALHIAIIGAGMAGLSCARALHEAGLTVSVFDKSRGLGGRLCTRRGEHWQADHGAQYFTARDPAFLQQIDSWLADGHIAVWPGRPAAIGTTPDEHSDEPLRYVGVPGMSAPAKALAAGLPQSLSHTVQQLHAHDDGWQLASKEHGTLPARFDAVVLAVPPAQAVPLLTGHSAALHTLAASHHMLPCWTVLARFAERQPLPFDAAFVNEGPLRWLARNNSKPGRSGEESWVLQANAAWSEQWLEADAEAVIAELLAAFRQLGGGEPVATGSHRWRYADSVASHTGSGWDGSARLGLCGDWLHGGKVEGAWLSGRHLAQRMLASL